MLGNNSEEDFMTETPVKRKKSIFDMEINLKKTFFKIRGFDIKPIIFIRKYEFYLLENNFIINKINGII